MCGDEEYDVFECGGPVSGENECDGIIVKV